jgi:hypothetical protein
MTARISQKGEYLRPGPLGDYVQAPAKYLGRFFRTTIAFIRGDPRLLIRNPKILNPPLYFAACIAIAIALVQSFWPDDPIKTFDNPSYLRPIEPFLNLVPLPLFAVASVYVLLINMPMLITSSVLGYNFRIYRIAAASSYAFATSILLSVIIHIATLLSRSPLPVG